MALDYQGISDPSRLRPRGGCSGMSEDGSTAIASMGDGSEMGLGWFLSPLMFLFCLLVCRTGISTSSQCNTARNLFVFVDFV
jgi:hypothetical protein